MSNAHLPRVKGFKFGVRSAGLKRSGKPDLALVY